MARLKHSELKVLSDSLLELYSPGPYADLPARLIALVRRHFSCDNYCWNEFAGKTALRTVHEPDFSGSVHVLNHYIDQHPLATALLKDQVQSSVKISDFTTLRQWQQSDLWNNFFRLEGLNYQLTFFSSGQHQVGIALNRSQRDFSEEERSMLDLLGRTSVRRTTQAGSSRICQMAAKAPAKRGLLPITLDGSSLRPGKPLTC
jgi:hypothetical protein